MLSNDILRSLRYTLKVNNNDMVRILALSAMESTSASFDTWTTKEDEEGFVRCPDIILSGFLNGLIYDKRGKDDSAPELALERRVNNNTVLKKLRIAFSLKTDDIVAIMTEQKFRVSVPEVTAMMRAPDSTSFTITPSRSSSRVSLIRVRGVRKSCDTPASIVVRVVNSTCT